MKKPGNFEEMSLIHFDISELTEEIYTVIANHCEPGRMKGWLLQACNNKKIIYLVLKKDKELVLKSTGMEDFVITAKNYVQEEWVQHLYEILQDFAKPSEEISIEGEPDTKKGRAFVDMIQQSYGIIDKNCEKCGHMLGKLGPEGVTFAGFFNIVSGEIYICTNDKCSDLDFSDVKFEKLTEAYLKKYVLEPGDLKIVTNYKEFARKKLNDEILEEKTKCYICQKGTTKIHSLYAYTSFSEKRYKALMECDFCHTPLWIMD